MTHPRFLAEALRHSATCFLNSLFREWNQFEVVDQSGVQFIRVDLKTARRLFIPLSRFSPLGRHVYRGDFIFEEGHVRSSISFWEVVSKISHLLAAEFSIEALSIENFQQRVYSSVKTMAYALETRSRRAEPHERPLSNFIDYEQSLIIGHNFHPAPKSRGQMSDHDLLEFAPEFNGQFSMRWLMAHPSTLNQNCAASFANVKWTEELARQEMARRPAVDQTAFEELLARHFVPVPVHPWQWRRIQKIDAVRGYLESGLVVEIGEGGIWQPTSSLRSVYRENAPYMLKFSMSVKLTNSVRHLLSHEVERGLQLRDVLHAPLGAQFRQEYPRFKIITEPAYLAFKGADGLSLNETIVVCRDNPFSGSAKGGKAVLATLTQDPLGGGENAIIETIRGTQYFSFTELRERSLRWFDDYLSAAVQPLFVAQSRYGIILGAHQQNLILDLQNGWPVGAFFRDCQGTGYSEIGYKNFVHDVPSIRRDNGNVVSEKMGNDLFAYYLILNSTFNVISSICGAGWVKEAELFERLIKILTVIREDGACDLTCLDYVLNSPHLLHKGNFICSIRNMNENTMVDPLSIYSAVPNNLCGSTEMPEARPEAEADPTPGTTQNLEFPRSRSETETRMKKGITNV